MIVSLFTSVFVILVQVPSSSGHEAYVFDLKNRPDLVYGLVIPSDLEKSSFFIRIDEPWNRTTKEEKVFRSNIKEYWKELHNTRKGRIDGIWSNHQGIKIGDRWVLASELKLAERAQAMIHPEVEIVGVEDILKANVTETESVGFAARWGAHIAIGIGFVVLAGFAFWWGFLRQTWVGLAE